MLKSFQGVGDENILSMRNSSTAKVLGQGKVNLSLTFEKNLILNNVLYVPEIRTNLVLVNFLIKRGFKIILESNKFTLLKNMKYMGMRYVLGEMFKFNINNEIDSFFYILLILLICGMLDIMIC